MCVFVAVLMLAGCKHEKAKTEKTATQLKTVTAQLQSVPTKLFYSGTVSPLQIFSVSSPNDGTIKEINFKYGDRVTAGQTLMTISSSKLQEDYRNTLTQYLKAKQDYLNSTVNFQGAQELMKAQIISEQDFISEKSQYENTALTYFNAKLELEQMIQGVPDLAKKLENLTLDDIENISKILQEHYDTLTVTATEAGVVLVPTKSDTSSDDSSAKKLQVGTQVKQGQTLLIIGDLSGISTTVQVSELVINKIKIDQPVIVTVDALPNMSFKGGVKAISAQSQSSDSDGGLVSYPVTVIVPKLTLDQSNLLKVGMTTKVEIDVTNPPQIMLPIGAVMQNNGVSTVRVLDPKPVRHKLLQSPQVVLLQTKWRLQAELNLGTKW
ncbi:MAG: efflux RND transporter periplasmic adaptor subunit [Coxiellaceae bacterium]|nr:MAG: efflux RND transporter periplasmic adaptor subunit [Coxiellaceae bacterium]